MFNLAFILIKAYLHIYENNIFCMRNTMNLKDEQPWRIYICVMNTYRISQGLWNNVNLIWHIIKNIKLLHRVSNKLIHLHTHIGKVINKYNTSGSINLPSKIYTAKKNKKQKNQTTNKQNKPNPFNLISYTVVVIISNWTRAWTLIWRKEKHVKNLCQPWSFLARKVEFWTVVLTRWF